MTRKDFWLALGLVLLVWVWMGRYEVTAPAQNVWQRVDRWTGTVEVAGRGVVPSWFKLPD